MPLHEKWSQYTAEEIRKIKVTKCIKCIHLGARDGASREAAKDASMFTCSYLLNTGHRRPWRPEDCPKMTGKRKRERKAITYGKAVKGL